MDGASQLTCKGCGRRFDAGAHGALVNEEGDNVCPDCAGRMLGEMEAEQHADLTEALTGPTSEPA